jgi:hypothetical protein
MTTAIAQSNSLSDLAARIKAEHEAFVAAVKGSLARAMAAGDLLIEAKAIVDHGQWLPWLEQIGLPRRTASHYMRLSRHRDTVESEMGNVAHLSVRAAVEALTPPEPEIEPTAAPSTPTTTPQKLPATDDDFDDDAFAPTSDPEEDNDEFDSDEEPDCTIDFNDLKDAREEVYSEHEWRRQRMQTTKSALYPKWKLEKFMQLIATINAGKFWNENLKPADRQNFMKKCKGGPLHLMLPELSAHETFWLPRPRDKYSHHAKEAARAEWHRAYDAVVAAVNLTEEETNACQRNVTPIEPPLPPEPGTNNKASLNWARDCITKIVIADEMISFFIRYRVKQIAKECRLRGDILKRIQLRNNDTLGWVTYDEQFVPLLNVDKLPSSICDPFFERFFKALNQSSDEATTPEKQAIQAAENAQWPNVARIRSHIAEHMKRDPIRQLDALLRLKLMLDRGEHDKVKWPLPYYKPEAA